MFGTVIGIVFCTIFSLVSLFGAVVFGYSYIVDVLLSEPSSNELGLGILFAVMLLYLILQIVVFLLNLIPSVIMIKKSGGGASVYAKISVVITSVSTVILGLVTLLTYLQCN